VTGANAHGGAPRPLLAAAAVIAGLLVAVALLGSAKGAVGGNPIVVQNANDHGPGSLRQAIADADAGTTIKVPAGKYTLTSGELLVDKRLQIRGVGARKTIVDGNDASRVFEIASVATGTTISGLTVQHGNAGQENGGGIALSGASLRLVKVAVKNNRVNFNNNASGGGIDGSAASALFLSRSVVSGNHGYNGAGADVPRVEVFASTIARNTAGGPNSNGDAGAVQADQLVLTFSTVSRNRCFNGPGCGGAFFLNRATVRDSIIAGNSAFRPNGKPAGSVGNPGKQDNCGAGKYTSKGHNLEGLRDCGFTKRSDLQRTNPLLKKLANYGGQTNTMALGHRSPAVDAGSRCKSTDQRRVPRPQGPRCDIGAFELKQARAAHG
jgi:hypothetical protein